MRICSKMWEKILPLTLMHRFFRVYVREKRLANLEFSKQKRKKEAYLE